jgi:hypothetical protein
MNDFLSAELTPLCADNEIGPNRSFISKMKGNGSKFKK